MKLKTYMGILGVSVLAAIGSCTTLYTVDETEQVVITRFGKAISEVKEPGLHVKAPLIDTVNTFDDRVLDYQDASRKCPTADKKFIEVDNYAKWKITDPTKFFASVRTENGAQTRLDDIIYSSLREGISENDLIEIVKSTNREIITTEKGVGGDANYDEISVGRAKIMDEVTERSKKTALSYGVEILDVRIKRADLPKEVEQSVHNRMIAERKKIASKYRSEGEAEQAKIQGKKELELKKIKSEAYRLAEEIRGEGDAEALKILADAFNRNPKFYAFKKALDVYKNSMVKSKLILSTGSELFKYLKGGK